MKRTRLISLLLSLVLLTGPVFAAGTPLLPYAIKVNRAMNTVTIYSPDETGQYTVPVKAMICSTARQGYYTPLGTFTLAAYRSPWRLMVDGTYGQYATSFSGHYLFHSICYSDDSHDAMVRESYNKLGEPASMGCVRLETVDAKWIYENCPAGTPVTVYEDPESPGPLGKPEPTIDDIPPEYHNGWDPTDPAEGNPWHLEPMTELTLSAETLDMTAGEAVELRASAKPERAMVFWSVSDETVAKVDNWGKVTALSSGTVTVTAQGLNGVSASCTVQVEGELLPFDDLTPGAWYYPEVRQALERELVRGTAERQFSPAGTMTRAMTVQVLYNLEKASSGERTCDFSDAAQDAWYYDAVCWAASEGIVGGVTEGCFAPNRPITRQELAAILWRYAGCPKAEGSVNDFSDGGQVSYFAVPAMGWAAGEGLLQGAGGALNPRNTASRVETAVLLNRFAAMK